MIASSKTHPFFIFLIVGMGSAISCFSQTEGVHPVVGQLPADSVKKEEDTTLRIINLNPYFTLHVDSTLSYKLDINKDPSHYFWFLRNSPPGLKINKDNGLLTFRADRSFFLSGKLKYDNQYRVSLGVQNLNNPVERVDTSFTLMFFTTEIVPSHVKPTVSNVLYIEEGDTVNFKVECETGSFPIESINFFSNIPIKNYTVVKKCDDDFSWSPPFDFVKETDSSKQKLLVLTFIGINKFFVKDTSVVKIYVKDALDYPVALLEYNQAFSRYNKYVLQLKYTFVQLDRKVKHVRNTRSSFDMGTASTALGGTVLANAAGTGTQDVGKVLPSVGVTLVPVKELVAPAPTPEQNSASTIRASIKRMEYNMTDNTLVGGKDMDIVKKTAKLKEELKETQIQLIDMPIEEETSGMTEDELNAYFNSPKVNKKYRLKKNK